MNFKTLIGESDVRALTAADLDLAAIPRDGTHFLREAARAFASQNAAYVRLSRIGESLEISSYPYGSATWYADRRMRAIVWPSDLVVDGDLIDDDFSLTPLLVVRGNLTVRSWLRGGMPAFVGGDVHASGFVVGHYDDSALFVGGSLTAAGYVPRAKPYADFRDVQPHQIVGRIDARTIDINIATEADLAAAFVDDVLIRDDGLSIDEKRILGRVAEGLPVWRQAVTG